MSTVISTENTADLSNASSSTSSSSSSTSAKESKVGKWHVNAVGDIIYKNHEAYTLMLQIQMGIRYVVSDANAKRNRDVTMKDFEKVVKIDFPSKGSATTPPHNYPSFTFHDYMPIPFKNLRERFGIEASHYLVSLCHDRSLSIIGTPGKSGALFFFSEDMQYILKTVSKKESKFLRKILPQYYNHVMQYQSTLINRFYGLYSIKPSVGKNVRFIVMNNVFDTQFEITEKYDLKGSTIGRNASEKEKKKKVPVFKDLDFLSAKRRISVGPILKKKIADQLKADCLFLEKMKIMDYSLLLGIRKLTPGDKTYLAQHPMHPSAEPKATPVYAPVAASSATTTQASPSGENNTLSGRQSSESENARTEEDITEATNRELAPSSLSASAPLGSSLGRENSTLSEIPPIILPERPAEQSAPPTPQDINITVTQASPQPTQPLPPASSGTSLSTTTSAPPSRPSLDLKQVPSPTTPNKRSSGSVSARTGVFKFVGKRASADVISISKYYRGERVSEFQKNHGGIISTDGEEMYFFGIIDLLQKWNSKKQLENVFLGIKHDRSKVSAVSPKNYASRFQEFFVNALQ